MAFFDQVGASRITVEAAQGYDKEYSAMQTLVECHQNELMMFTGLIQTDFQEATMIREGASIESIEALQESVIGTVFNKIKEMFKKLWAKIKAIFAGFIAKFDSVFMKSNKEFIKKYSAKVYSKQKLSDLNVKYAKEKSGADYVVSSANIVISAGDNRDEDMEENEREEFYLKQLTGLDTTVGDFEKDYHEKFYEDESEYSADEVIDQCVALLSGRDETIKKVKKANDTLDKTIKYIISEIDKDEKALTSKFKLNDDKTTNVAGIGIKYSGDGTSKATRSGKDRDETFDNKSTKIYSKAQNTVARMSKNAAACQRAITKVTAGSIREAKFGATQARRVVAKVIAYSPKNESVFLNAVEEAAIYEAELDLA